jgi:hypothetical protein
MTNPILQAALDYRKAGLSPIPTSLKTKAPAVPWKIYQERQATETELREMFKTVEALGIITGAVSGNLEIQDFDNKAELFSAWAEIVNRDFLSGLSFSNHKAMAAILLIAVLSRQSQAMPNSLSVGLMLAIAS